MTPAVIQVLIRIGVQNENKIEGSASLKEGI